MNIPSLQLSENANNLCPPRILLLALVIFALNSIRLTRYLAAFRKDAIAGQPTSFAVAESIVLAIFSTGRVKADLLRGSGSLAGGIVFIKVSRRVMACYFLLNTRGAVGEDCRFVSLDVRSWRFICIRSFSEVADVEDAFADCRRCCWRWWGWWSIGTRKLAGELIFVSYLLYAFRGDGSRAVL